MYVTVVSSSKSIKLVIPLGQHVSARPELGVATAKARKKMIPRRFPGLKPLGWRQKHQKWIDLDLNSTCLKIWIKK